MKYLIRQWIEVLHANEQCPRLMVDATVTGVEVPERVKAQWGQAMPIDLDASYPLELAFEDRGIRCSLSFGGPFECFFPWESIYVVQERETRIGIVVEENLPERLRKRGEDGQLRPAVGEMLAAPRPGRPQSQAQALAPAPTLPTAPASSAAPASPALAPVPMALAETSRQAADRVAPLSPQVLVQESPELRRTRFRVINGGRSDE